MISEACRLRRVMNKVGEGGGGEGMRCSSQNRVVFLGLEAIAGHRRARDKGGDDSRQLGHSTKNKARDSTHVCLQV